MRGEGHACGAGEGSAARGPGGRSGRTKPPGLALGTGEGVWAWSAGQRKVVMDESLKSLLSQEALERIVQDVHFHEELVFLNVLHVDLAG